MSQRTSILRSKVLVLGANGLLGRRVVSHLARAGFDIVSASSSGDSADLAVDARSLESVLNAVQVLRPQFVLNLVALTSVDKCETDPALAESLNVAPNVNLTLARFISKVQFRVIYMSTDHVYDRPGCSLESEELLIRNVYAMTKLQGEQVLDQSHDVILRTNFVGSSKSKGRESLTDWVVSVARSGSRAQILSDVYFSPVSMLTLSNVLEAVIKGPKPGIFNVGSKTWMSKAEFDLAFLDALGLPATNFSTVTQAEVTFLGALRPSYMQMDSSSFEKSYSFELPTLETEILLTAKEYLND